MPGRFFAHSFEGRPHSEWQDLREHLEGVARLAASFADVFGSSEWGHLAGLWHDVGKYRPEFQSYIRGERASGGEHAVVGALLSRSKNAPRDYRSLPLDFVITGHHAGLANLAVGEGGARSLKRHLEDAASLWDEARPHVPEDLIHPELPTLPERLGTPPPSRADAERQRRQIEVWTRFLFSALVDADFVDTERFYRGDERSVETRGFGSIAQLRARLDAEIDRIAARATPGQVNTVRAEVLAACRTAAEEPPGLFSLSVPTGGGKTLSSMAFALRHAERRGLRRVIVVIPYTSIIEQNAAVYRRALGEENVIEHHSGLDPEKESRRNKLASENWDAPVVVTTTVQLFESFYANRPSRCRKLHNVARSVLVLDEAQSLPVAFQVPILEALRELTAHFGCSVVLSTATQPAFERRPGELDHGLEGIREIIPDPRRLARRLRRYEVCWPAPGGAPITWQELAAELTSHQQALAVVHRRQDARDLAQRLPEEGRFHLSALMCAAHRSKVLAKARAALADGEPCRLVSTQLIEAGVDVDFPLVYRALGGLDSLVQAGGRCNREGRAESGRLIVYRAPTSPPPGTPRLGLETMEALLEIHGPGLDVSDPERVAEYFRMLFGKEAPDAHGIEAERARLSFATVAARFRLIEDRFTRPVVVPHDEARERLERLRREGPSRERLRALQPYVVNVATWHLEKLQKAAAVELAEGIVYAVNPGYEGLYDERFGLLLDDEPVSDPAALVI